MPYDWPVTQSALDLQNISELAKSIDNLGTTLKTFLNSDYNKNLALLSSIREAVIMFCCKLWLRGLCRFRRSLPTLCEANIEDQDVKDSSKNVNEKLKQIVQNNIHLGKK